MRTFRDFVLIVHDFSWFLDDYLMIIWLLFHDLFMIISPYVKDLSDRDNPRGYTDAELNTKSSWSQLIMISRWLFYDDFVILMIFWRFLMIIWWLLDDYFMIILWFLDYM